MKHIITAAITLTAMLPLASARAADIGGGNPTGPYIGAGVGQFNLDIDRLEDVGDTVESIANGDDRAWKVFAGYRLLPMLAIEAAYIDLGDPDDDFSASGSDGRYRVEMSGFSAAVVGMVPIGPVELFAKIGQYWYDVDTRIDLDVPLPDVDSSRSRSDLVWGGGVAFVAAEHLVLRAEYERLEIENARRSEAFWLSAGWRF